MKKLFYMHIVTTREGFEKAVISLIKQNKSKLYHCYVSGDIFKITTATRVQQFDFSSFESEEEIVTYIQKAMEILKKNLKGKLLMNIL